MNDDAPIPLPISDELDLHTFRPQDLGELIPTYLAEARARGLRTVRLIHGKGRGTLRATVHALASRSPDVASLEACDEASGGWGATRVRLKS